MLQFGYVSMFAVVFPLAPLFAYINNIWEFKLDLSQLVKTRRPKVSERGIWLRHGGCIRSRPAGQPNLWTDRVCGLFFSFASIVSCDAARKMKWMNELT